jgi:hypothetical protein
MVTRQKIITIFSSMKKNIPVISVLAALLIGGCSYLSSADKKAEYPKSPDDVRRQRAGSLLGEGGFSLFGGKGSDDDAGGNSGIGINSYLWRASLDTLAFMPLASADPFGGVILTDWYEDPAAKGERFKVNLLILSAGLRSDSVKITLFKQVIDSGAWRDAEVNKTIATDLENKILTRARELRIEKEGK